MSYKFSESSQAKLLTCDPRLQRVFNEVIKGFDCTIICGKRSLAEQQEAYDKGFSKVKPGQSKHNVEPLSQAVDVAPYPIDWHNTEAFCHFAGFVMGIAHSFGVSLRWGGDWDEDRDLKDQTFMDLAHFELKGP